MLSLRVLAAKTVSKKPKKTRKPKKDDVERQKMKDLWKRYCDYIIDQDTMDVIVVPEDMIDVLIDSLHEQEDF